MDFVNYFNGLISSFGLMLFKKEIFMFAILSTVFVSFIGKKLYRVSLSFILTHILLFVLRRFFIRFNIFKDTSYGWYMIIICLFMVSMAVNFIFFKFFDILLFIIGFIIGFLIMPKLSLINCLTTIVFIVIFKLIYNRFSGFSYSLMFAIYGTLNISKILYVLEINFKLFKSIKIPDNTAKFIQHFLKSYKLSENWLLLGTFFIISVLIQNIRIQPSSI